MTDTATSTAEGTQTAGTAIPAQTATPAAAPINIRAEGRLPLSAMGGSQEPPKIEETPAIPAKTETPATETVKTETPIALEKVEGKEGEPLPEARPAAVTPTVLKTKTGREFKDPTELLTAYENSSVEALRLAAYEKTAKFTIDDMASKLQSANNAILELQTVAGNVLFPGLKSTEELEAMNEEDRQNYYLDKRDWNKRQESFKTRIATAKEESEKFATRVQEEITRNDQLMRSDPAKYPDFTQLEPLTNEILEKSPHLANRPDSRYNAYIMAMGLTKMKELETARNMTEQARIEAANKAEAAGKQGATGATPAAKEVKPAPRSDGLDKLVEAGTKRRSVY